MNFHFINTIGGGVVALLTHLEGQMRATVCKGGGGQKRSHKLRAYLIYGPSSDLVI